MRIFTAYATKNRCYKKAQKMPKGKPEGIVVHSTGANNPNLKRYVDAPEECGKNTLGNHWNNSVIGKCPHAFIGYDINKTIAVANILPYDICCWGCGKGKKGSYNYSPAYVQFEICEDNLKDATYFKAVIATAIEYCAYLCKEFNIPVSKIVSHREAHGQGYASNHSDIDHWLAKHGKNMGWFRVEVEKLLNDKPVDPVVNYRVHIVVAGDSLWNIAKKYLGSGAKYPSIMKLNGLKKTTIYKGMKLYIPNK